MIRIGIIAFGYVMRPGDRDGLAQHLAEANIGTGIHDPVPLHLQQAYKRLGYTIQERVVSELISFAAATPPVSTLQSLRHFSSVAS